MQILRQKTTNYFFMATTHHDINHEVDLTFNEKRVESLRAKQQAKTKIDRQRPFFYTLLVVAFLCEALDGVLTFSGIIHFASTHLSDNGFLIFGLIGVAVVALSVMKHLTMDVFHAQRLDDNFVPISTYILMSVFFLVSALATYNVTPAALDYMTEKPVLLNVDSIGLRYDSLLAADLVLIAKEIDTHKETARAIHKASSWNGKLDMNSQTKYENALSSKNTATVKKTDISLARKSEKETAIKTAQSKNEATIKKHSDWCYSFGGWLALGLVIVELCLYPSKWFCETYKRLEVIEADKKKEKALAAQGQSLQPTTQSTNAQTTTNASSLPQKKAKGKRSNVFGNPNLAPTMQFPQGQPSTNSAEPKEGDILPPQGKGVHRVLIEVNGKLDARTRGELRTLKAAQGNPESERAKFIQTLIDKLP